MRPVAPGRHRVRAVVGGRTRGVGVPRPGPGCSGEKIRVQVPPGEGPRRGDCSSGARGGVPPVGNLRDGRRRRHRQRVGRRAQEEALPVPQIRHVSRGAGV